MKLRTKIVITVAVFSILGLYTFFCLFNSIFINNFNRIEMIEAVNEMKVVKSYISDFEAPLGIISSDLLSDDNTYQFFRELSNNNITENIKIESIRKLGVDYIIFINHEGRIIYSKGWNDENDSKIGVPEYLLQYIQKQKIDELEHLKSGYAYINGNAIALTSSAIKTGSANTAEGIMVLGKKISDADINCISDKSGLKVKIVSSPEALNNVSSFKYDNEEIFLNSDKNDILHIYSHLNRYENNSSILLSIEMNRDISILSNRGKILLFVTISFILILFVLLFIFILNKFVFKLLNQQLALFDTVPAMVFYKDSEFRYITANKLFYKFFNTNRKKVIGRTIDEIVGSMIDVREVNKIDDEVGNTLKPISNKEIECIDEKGTIYLSISESPVINLNGGFDGIVGIISDITETKKKDEKLKLLSYYDNVTMFPNREYFMEYLSSLMEKKDKKFSVLYIRPNDFDMINEIAGPSSSDEFLKVIAQRVSACLRPGDLLSRIRGDEFAVIYQESDREKIIVCCNNIFQIIKKAWEYDGRKYYLSANIGIITCPYDGNTTDNILKNSNTAMHMSKVKGKNYYTFYSKEDSEQVIERVELENDLRHAVMRSELELYYQPQVDTSTRNVFGYEALLRWNHPKKGLVSPGVFIPLAEETGLIVPIGKWVIWEACRQLKEWNDNGIERKVSINISAKQLEDEKIVVYIRDSIKNNSLPPSILEIEITESVIMKDGEKTLKKLQEIKDMGVNILLDDFGTGYSSLLYLKEFPINKIKIDQNFVRDINESDDEAIVNTIITLSKGLGMKTIAEGVETEEQYAILKEMGCDEIQGYLFGKPARIGTF